MATYHQDSQSAPRSAMIAVDQLLPLLMMQRRGIAYPIFAVALLTVGLQLKQLVGVATGSASVPATLVTIFAVFFGILLWEQSERRMLRLRIAKLQMAALIEAAKQEEVAAAGARRRVSRSVAAPASPVQEQD